MVAVDTEVLVSEILIDIKAVHCNLDEPFVFTSGTVSPAYVDCRKIISFPTERRKIIELACAVVKNNIEKNDIEVVAGGETAGIPFAAWLSDYLNLPMIYVRKAPKGFGRLAQIEGNIEPGRKVLLVEDLIFDAKSKETFAEGIKKAGAIVENCLVVFDYGFRGSREKLKRNGIGLYSLSNWDILLRVGKEKGYFTGRQIEEIQGFLNEPGKWAENRMRNLT